MKAAVAVFGAIAGTFGLIALLSVTHADAQPAADDKSADLGVAPVALAGWHDVGGPDRLHVYVCDHSDCVPGSKVICYFYPLNTAMAPGLFRRQEEIASQLLQERPKPSTKSTGLGIDLATARMREVETASDGSKNYKTHIVVKSSKWEVFLISSSIDEKASDANSTRFETALLASP